MMKACLSVFLPGRDVCLPAVWLLLCQWHHSAMAGLLGVCGGGMGLWWGTHSLLQVYFLSAIASATLQSSASSQYSNILSARRRSIHGRCGSYDRLSAPTLHEVVLVLHHTSCLCGMFCCCVCAHNECMYLPVSELLFDIVVYLQGVFLFHVVNYKPLTYNTVYTYPLWGEAFGWGLALSSMLCIPVTVLYKLLRCKGSLREVSVSPSMYAFFLLLINQ